MTTESPATPSHRRPDIQGLRAVAVLAVVAHHAWQGLLPGGFAGVDVFFVLSGFLITGILVREMDERRFSLVAFYKRRIRRLFPALFVVLAASMAAGMILLPPQGLKELALTQFFTNLFVSNLAFIKISGYFDPDASLRPLLHTWSLGVEEQFYLLFPPLLLLLHRFARKLLWPVLILLALLSLYVAQDWLVGETTKAFYHPYTRAVELLIGALCVGFPRHVDLGRQARRALSWLGLLTILGSLVLLNGQTPFPGLWALPPCLGTAALLIARDGEPNRWLGVRPLVIVGDMSYSLYLWHWPLLVYGHLAFGLSPWVTGSAVLMSFVLAWLSRRYVEEPWLRARTPPVWWPALAATAVSILVCLVAYNTEGLPQRFSPQAQAIFAGSQDYNLDRDRCHKRSDGELLYAETCVYGDKGATPSVAIWSDSIGVELAPGLGEALGRRGASLRSITGSGCPAGAGPVDSNCGRHNARILSDILADPSMKTVILVANYLGYAKEPEKGMPDSLMTAATALEAAGKQVILILPLPAYALDPPSEAGMALRLGRDPVATGMRTVDYDRTNGPTIRRLEAFAASEGVEVLRPRDLLCDAERCRIYDPALGMLYFNDVHLSLSGATLFTSPLMAMIEVAGASQAT